MAEKSRSDDSVAVRKYAGFNLTEGIEEERSKKSTVETSWGWGHYKRKRNDDAHVSGKKNIQANLAILGKTAGGKSLTLLEEMTGMHGLSGLRWGGGDGEKNCGTTQRTR